MRRSIWLALLFLTLATSTASAHGFGTSRRPVEARTSYYSVPSVVYYYSAAPRFVYSAPPVFAAPPIIFTPPVRFAPYASPVAAPSSVTGEPPLADPGRRSTGESSSPSTSLRSGGSFYSVLPGPRGMERSDDRCSIAFWNLTGGTLSLRIDGRDHVLSAGRSVTLDLPRTFAWQVSGREPEATRIAAGSATAEVLIRR